MYNPELQMRFMTSAADAMLHFATLSLASARAWQDQLSVAPKPNPPQTDPMAFVTNPLSAWAWVFEAWQPMRMAHSTPLVFTNRPVAPPLADPFSWFPTPAAAWPGANPSATWQPADPAMVSAFVEAFWTWPAVSWSLYRTPLTAMMVAYGMPYDMAVPAANAGTSALDAADAARLQWIDLFASYRTDGGHASAHVVEQAFRKAEARHAPTTPRWRH